jgi:hypothetical protein
MPEIVVLIFGVSDSPNSPQTSIGYRQLQKYINSSLQNCNLLAPCRLWKKLFDSLGLRLEVFCFTR